MMNIHVEEAPDVRINIAPLVDVIFILLIFVVLVAKFMDQERLDVTLPSADAGRPAEVQTLFIQLTEDGVVTIDGRVIADEDLDAALDARRGTYRRAVLLADQDTPLQDAVDVISAAKLAGYDGVALATRPPEQ